MFIKKLELNADLDQVRRDVDNILTLQPWPEGNQIGLNYRPNASNPWLDAAGSRYVKFSGQTPLEKDFSVWNPAVPAYITQQVELLKAAENCGLGRVRIMRLMPKTGLSVHFDVETRFHLVIKTNPNAYIAHCVKEARTDSVLPSTSISYHMPADGHWYEVDTRQMHYVYNGGHEERIHLVACRL